MWPTCGSGLRISGMDCRYLSLVLAVQLFYNCHFSALITGEKHSDKTLPPKELNFWLELKVPCTSPSPPGDIHPNQNPIQLVPLGKVL